MEFDDTKSSDNNNEAVTHGDDKRKYFDYLQYLWKIQPGWVQKKEETVVRQLNTGIIDSGSFNYMENSDEKMLSSDKQVGENAEKEESIDRDNFSEDCESDHDCRQNGEDYRLLNFNIS